jgi:ABC-2 type transport system ATP-binding protein
MPPIISVADLSKTYASGFQALKGINLSIRRGEILGLLGPNGAGKTTLISIICGIVNASQGKASLDQVLNLLGDAASKIGADAVIGIQIAIDSGPQAVVFHVIGTAIKFA